MHGRAPCRGASARTVKNYFELIKTHPSQSPRKYNTHTVSLSNPSTDAESVFAETRFDAVYLVLPQTAHAVEKCKLFLDLAKQHGVKFAVFLSVIGAEDLPAELAGRYLQVEAHLKAIRLPHTILRIAPLQQHFLYLSPDFHQRIPTIELPFSTGALAPIHAKDVASVTAAILDNPTRHAGKTYTLTGPDLLTGVEIAGRASVGLDRPVGFRNCLPSEARNHLLALVKECQPGRDEHRADAVEAALRMFGQVASNASGQRVTTTVQKLTARPATHIEDFFREHREHFNAPADEQSTSDHTAALAAAQRRRGSGLDFVSAAYVGADGNGLGRYVIRSKL